VGREVLSSLSGRQAILQASEMWGVAYGSAVSQATLGRQQRSV